MLRIKVVLICEIFSKMEANADKFLRQISTNLLVKREILGFRSI